MAETEIETTAAEAVADTTANQSDFGPGHDAHGELPPFDESYLICVKGRVKKPVKPDDTERNITIDKLSAEIKKHHDRIAEIKALELSRRTRAVNPEVVEHRRAKERLHGEWKAVLVSCVIHVESLLCRLTCLFSQQQKMLIREDFQRAQTEKEVLRNELREIRSKIPRGTKLETIESDIQQLEFKLEHDSMSGPEEKKAQHQMANLIAARPLSRQVTMLEDKLKIVEERRASAKEKLDQCDAVLATIKEQEQAEQTALDEYQRQREEANVDFPALQVEKQECWEVVQALKAKSVEVRDEFSKQYQEWQLQNKHYSIWLRHEKKAQ
jgi:chromosome segregation ATPase